MRIVSTSYSKTVDHSDPVKWLDRISFYTGILEELAKNHEVVSFERINYEGELALNNVKYQFVRFEQTINRFPRRMHRMIKQINPDIVLVNGLIFPMQVMQLRRYLKASAKIIVLHRSEKPGKGIHGFLQRKADNYIDAYLFSSEEIGMKWHKHGIIRNQDKIFEVMQASSSFKPKNDHCFVPNAPVFIWVGRLDRNKDPITLLKAFRLFTEEYPSSVLHMIFQSEELLAEVKSLAYGLPQIRLHGIQSHTDLEKWYQSADFAISTSHYEGGGIAVCEAMSCGCIPVLSRIDSFVANTGNGKCGILFMPGEPDDLLRAMRAAMKMDMPLERARTLDQFEKELSFPAIAKKIEILARSLTKRKYAGALPS